VELLGGRWLGAQPPQTGAAASRELRSGTRLRKGTAVGADLGAIEPCATNDGFYRLASAFERALPAALDPWLVSANASGGRTTLSPLDLSWAGRHGTGPWAVQTSPPIGTLIRGPWDGLFFLDFPASFGRPAPHRGGGLFIISDIGRQPHQYSAPMARTYSVFCRRRAMERSWRETYAAETEGADQTGGGRQPVQTRPYPYPQGRP